jgi:hypothetical protein
MTEIAEASVDEIIEGASEVAEGVVDIARGFSSLALSGAFVIGAGVGGAVGFFVCKRMLETKYNELADEAAEEIADMRQHYEAKAVALGDQTKPQLDELVREKGYTPADDSSAPPMAVTPPAAVVRAAEGEDEDSDDSDAEIMVDGTPVGQDPQVEVKNVFQEHGAPPDTWDWHQERSKRSPLRPYVIHRDEREENAAYEAVTFTYYEADDVLCNERDDVIPAEDRERIIGETNLEKFGHGSGDATIVYIRNDQLEMDVEVVRSVNSYSQEVHGFEPEPPTELRHSHSRSRRGRPSPDDE